MADTLNKFTRRTKAFYEAIYNQMMPGMIGIDQFLFPQLDIDTSAQFALDELIVNPHGIAFRERGAQSAVRPYTPGQGEIFEIPRGSEKTPITETLRDSVIAGGEATEGFASKHARLLSNIIRQHTVAHNITKWKLAIDVIRTGKYSPLGLEGNAIGDMEIDFSRDASLSATYDFTAVGADVETAIQELYDAYKAKNGPVSNLCIIMGEKWLGQFEDNSDILTKMQANTANVLISQQMMPPALQNTQGLYVAGQYRIKGRAVPVYICVFRPDAQWKSYAGATATNFVPEDEALMFNIGSSRYKIIRGVDVLDESRKAMRTAGEIVFDSYDDFDPVQTWLRSQSRVAFIPGDIDHTAISTGTFPEDS